MGLLLRPVIGAGTDAIDVSATLVAASNADELETTINIPIPGDAIGESFDYRVSLLQDGEVDNAAAHHPQDGTESHAVDGPVNTFRVLLVPFQYDADGSGRLPDTSPPTVDAYRDRLFQLYPVSAVEVEVRSAPVPWSDPITAFGSGWQEVFAELSNIRAEDAVPADVYLYGLFNPAPTHAEYCPSGCLNGLSILNDTPPDVGDPSLRFALGVGFPEFAADTMASRFGAAHGLQPAPCGDGQDPSSVDPNYPYAGGAIGVHFYDLVGGSLIGPDAFDISGNQCEPAWISDYNFARLLDRAANVNLP